mmetsp:Transcript_7432/g.15509  ORF Transcript_7432/g.15509 Transcript_7432/m.15509 type:complete len:224 (+) Transcript_7432:168-839(+)
MLCHKVSNSPAFIHFIFIPSQLGAHLVQTVGNEKLALSFFIHKAKKRSGRCTQHCADWVHHHFVKSFGIVRLKDAVNLFEALHAKSRGNGYVAQINKLAGFGVTRILCLSQHALREHDKGISHIIGGDISSRLHGNQSSIVDVDGGWKVFRGCRLNMNLGNSFRFKNLLQSGSCQINGEGCGSPLFVLLTHHHGIWNFSISSVQESSPSIRACIPFVAFQAQH